jgi:flagellar hook protein FlgE
MIRSMFTAISALNLNQTFLDVISDNLANSNTTGFKASRVIFQDQFAQIMSSGAAPIGEVGGINPTEVGLGVKLGYVSPTFTQGMMQSTGRSTDLAVQGNGFFIYSNGQETRYSREGSLEIDAAGYLVNNSTGMRITGWMIPPGAAGPVDTNQPTTTMQISLDATIARATANASLGGNLDSGLSLAVDAVADDPLTLLVDESVAAVPGAQKETTIAVYDSLGASHTPTIRFTRTSDPLEWTWQVTDPALASGNGTISFLSDGRFDSMTTAVPVVVPGSPGADPIDLNLDLSKLTMLSAETTISPRNQDGLAAGSVSDLYGAPNTGEMYLVYSNGLKQLVGQLALAHFTNPSGLLRAGGNQYKIGLNSGEPQIGTANTGGRGAISSGYLEASNVDMAQEFTNMILAQRSFQASTRVITTSDQILQELVNLKQ